MHTGTRVHPASYVISTGSSFLASYSAQGVMLTTHLHFSVEVKNEWSYTSIPPVYLHGEYNCKLIFTFAVWHLGRRIIKMFTTADIHFS
jgi:hypothetical protein